MCRALCNFRVGLGSRCLVHRGTRVPQPRVPHKRRREILPTRPLQRVRHACAEPFVISGVGSGSRYLVHRGTGVKSPRPNIILRKWHTGCQRNMTACGLLYAVMPCCLWHGWPEFRFWDQAIHLAGQKAESSYMIDMEHPYYLLKT